MPLAGPDPAIHVFDPQISEEDTFARLPKSPPRA
jgi:hypothetical protein